jgi:hypothetical protein
MSCWQDTMETRFCMQAMVFVLVSSLLYPGPSLQTEKGKSQEIHEPKSLIRKELLIRPEKTLSPPKRNIFTRQRSTGAPDESTSAEDFQLPGQRQLPGQMEQPEQAEPPIEEVRADVKYIGYVRSGTKVVALIIFENETYAVQSGDVLGTGLTIGEITADDMEIFDRGPEPIRIVLEGEKP